MSKPWQTLEQAINVRVSDKLVSPVNVNDDKYVYVSFKLTEGKYAGCHVSALVSVGEFDPYYVEFKVTRGFGEDIERFIHKGLGCEDACNLQDQLIEILASDLEYDTESKAYSDFETDISFTPKSYEELENISDKECDLILIDRELLDIPEHTTGRWPADVTTYPYEKDFDQEKYIAAFWGQTEDNYILLQDL